MVRKTYPADKPIVLPIFIDIRHFLSKCIMNRIIAQILPLIYTPHTSGFAADISSSIKKFDNFNLNYFKSSIFI